MASPKANGRMLRKTISESKKFASLSSEAGVLFCLLIPHFNSHGKMPGGPGYIKDEIAPFIEYFTYQNLPDYLQEISDKTNVKWFEHDGRRWLHSLNFLSEHQDLRQDKLGDDDLPGYVENGVEPENEISEYGTSTGLVRDYSETSEEQGADLPSLRSLKLEEGRKKGEGVVVDTARACDEGSPPPEDPQIDDFSDEVKKISELHLQVCGVGAMPPLDVIRAVLDKGVALLRIRDVYAEIGGDPMRFRQRNVVERLIALRDGKARASPRSTGKKTRDKKQEKVINTARELMADGPPRSR